MWSCLKKFLELFKKEDPIKNPTTKSRKQNSSLPSIQPARIGELGEYKINIQLDQLPEDYKMLKRLAPVTPRLITL